MADIVIAAPMDPRAVERLAGRAVLHDPALAGGALAAAVGDARALVVGPATPVGADLIAAAPKLVLLASLGNERHDGIDGAACEARGVEVVRAVGAADPAIAEWVLAAALMLRRGLVVTGRPDAPVAVGQELAGAVLGLVGFGHTAREVARRAGAFGLVVLAYDPFVKDADPAWTLARQHGLEPLLREADIVSLHVPATGDTRRMLDALRLARMKRGAVVLNSARAALVDEPALAAALRAGQLGGAALDVAEDAAGLAGVPNLILTPRIAAATEAAAARAGRLVVDALLAKLGART